MPSRRTFVSASLAAAGGAGLPPPSLAEAVAPAPAPTAPYFPLLRRGEYDHAALVAVLTLPAQNKQVFLSDATMNGLPGIPNLFEKMTNGWTAYEFAFLPRPARQSLAVAGVLIAGSVVFALNDAMWQKYRIASVLKLTDRRGAVVNYNYSARPTSNLDINADPSSPTSIYHDYSSAALLRRGAHFMVCHNAIAGTSRLFVASSGVSRAAIVDEWTKNLLPGFQVIPAGAAVIELLLEHGWHLYPVTD